MADQFRVIPLSLKGNGNVLMEQVDGFRDDVQRASAAASDLSAMWKGDAQQAFMAQEEECEKIYQLMEETLISMSLMLTSACMRYTELDERSSKQIRSV